MLEVAHSGDRLWPYFTASGGDLKGAIDLYIWNTAVSAAFYGPLQAVEIGLRNAVHRELSTLFGLLWHDDARFLGLNSKLPGEIQDVKDTLVEARKPIDTPHIVAGLNFGFWNRLLGPGPRGIYTTALWNRGLKDAFPNSPYARGPAFDEVKKIRDFRNRIAHHEPIYYRNLSAEYNRVKTVLAWMYNDLTDWVDYHGRCEEIISHRPFPRQVF